MLHPARSSRTYAVGALTLMLFLSGACGRSDATRPDASRPAASPLAPDAATTAPPAQSDRPVVAPRPSAIDDNTPEGAVTGFIAAESAEAYDLSYALLSAPDRDRSGSINGWRDRHAGFWPIAAGDVTDTRPDGETVIVTASLRFHSRLDESVGLVPARGEATWRVVREADRWRIAFDATRLVPALPDESDATTNVADWAKSRQACTSAPQYDGGLVGFPSLADGLCRRDGAVEVDEVEPLEEGPDADPFVAAFGPDVVTWARVVAVRAPVDVRVVVAPIAERWTVIGVLGAAPVL